MEEKQYEKQYAWHLTFNTRGQPVVTRVEVDWMNGREVKLRGGFFPRQRQSSEDGIRFLAWHNSRFSAWGTALRVTKRMREKLAKRLLEATRAQKAAQVALEKARNYG
jgi:hypothetical protein